MAHDLTTLTLDPDPDTARRMYLNAILERLNDAQVPQRQTSREEVNINGTWLRIHRPRTNAFGDPPGVVIFVRGGYGQLGNGDTHDALAKRYCDLPAVVMSVDILNDQATFEANVQAVLTAVRHADNAPLIRTTLSTQVAFVGIDVGASLALEAANRLAASPTLDGELAQPWTVKGVHLFDPITEPAMVDISLDGGLVHGNDIARLVSAWPALADAKAALDEMHTLAFPVLVSASARHPGADASEDVFTRLVAIDDHNVLGISVNIDGAESVLATKDHPIIEGAIAGLVHAFGAMVNLPTDTVR